VEFTPLLMSPPRRQEVAEKITPGRIDATLREQSRRSRADGISLVSIRSCQMTMAVAIDDMNWNLWTQCQSESWWNLNRRRDISWKWFSCRTLAMVDREKSHDYAHQPEVEQF